MKNVAKNFAAIKFRHHENVKKELKPDFFASKPSRAEVTPNYSNIVDL